MLIEGRHGYGLDSTAVLAGLQALSDQHMLNDQEDILMDHLQCPNFTEQLPILANAHLGT